MARCYYCRKEVSTGHLKRCSRCLLVTYCSPECQRVSWKMGHKRNCMPHPSGEKPAPAPGSEEWATLEVDKSLSKWIAIWRPVFTKFTTYALDLANHPENRSVTHCMFLVVTAQDNPKDKSRTHSILDAKIVPCDEVDRDFPEFGGVVDKPDDFTRLRYLVLLLDHNDEPLRIRCVMWNDSGIEDHRKMDKAQSKELAGTALGALVYSVDNLDVDQVPGC